MQLPVARRLASERAAIGLDAWLAGGAEWSRARGRGERRAALRAGGKGSADAQRSAEKRCVRAKKMTAA